MTKLPRALLVYVSRLARGLAPTVVERGLSAALLASLDDPEATRVLLRELDGAADHVALTERAMALQILHDRQRKGPALRGPFYEEGELVRHLERGEERLVRRHLRILEAR